MLRGVPVALLLAVLAPKAAVARCGDAPGDAAAVAAARSSIDEMCDCSDATPHGQYVRCAVSVVRTAVLTGHLPSYCKGAVVRCAARSICGKAGFVTCCRTTATGATSCKIKRDPALCVAPVGGEACVGVFPSCCDACTDSGCATTTTTTSAPPSTTTSSTTATSSTTTSSTSTTSSTTSASTTSSTTTTTETTTTTTTTT